MSDYLPADALISILTLLPPKSLVQLRCVCKTWQSLITSHDFICAYLQTPLLLLRHTEKYGEELYSLRSDDADFTSLRDFKCPFKTHSGCFFRVVGCCNGVICLSDDFACYNYTIILWNPSIRRYLGIFVWF
ncbi:hypothetical protein RHGRI_021184 [Rhododendron griersonianum]|uniref:F-box domain-containing protein n=1 Tax=Rhododendron griersonianum TaxID=479676 RepID=A0AAV6JNQ9_9ERIC|nr:hypothetical protein RHGRI_021184 [Rhododendron griersonianum]